MRLAKVWTAIDKLSVIWKSDMANKIKRNFFQAAVVSILLYGCTTSTLTKRMEKECCEQYWTSPGGSTPQSSSCTATHHPKTIKTRRISHVGHCWRSRDELISDLLQWIPSQAKARRLARTYIQHLCFDTGCSPEDLPEAMDDRVRWWERFMDIHADGATWWRW